MAQEQKPWEKKLPQTSTEPSLGLLQKYFGPTFMKKKRKKDIHLPSRPDEIDPRILESVDKGSTMDKIKFGRSIFNNLAGEK